MVRGNVAADSGTNSLIVTEVNSRVAGLLSYIKQLDGSKYAGLNCTCASAAMALDRHTLAQHRTTGAYVRSLTGDTVGGTNLAQIDAALIRRWGVNLDVHYGLDFATFEARIRSGQGAILQGWEAVTRGTRWSASETFGGNHAWFVNDVNTSGFLVFDPLADGRRDGIATSPFRIPRLIVREWAGKLNVATSGYRALGLGKVYAAFTKDTEPHVHLRTGAKRTSPFPDRVRADELHVKVYRTPSTSATLVDTLDRDDLFTAYQQTDAWLGNHNGTGWVRKVQMRRIGGST